MYQRQLTRGFTLIELSIVLVIIGLIVGGTLVGRDLINSAAVRAQISQIEKYNQAVATFKGKYGQRPGDITDPDASNFGFIARGQFPGEGDGNGLIEGVDGNTSAAHYCLKEGAGEIPVFWVDLSKAGLIDGSFKTANETSMGGADLTGTLINTYMPTAKIGGGNYLYVYSGGFLGNGNPAFNGVNYFGLSAVTNIGLNSSSGFITTNNGLTVTQAYNIDKKIDDGLPVTGRVIADFPNMGSYSSIQYGGAISSSATSCFDNGGVYLASYGYSLQGNGNLMNCGLSFQFSE
jgi:prepilin-type N-terminal cleavage/methylation domain-containing protein